MTTGQGVGDVWFVVPPGPQFGAVGSPVAVPSRRWARRSPVAR